MKAIGALTFLLYSLDLVSSFKEEVKLWVDNEYSLLNNKIWIIKL
jgi:hypothetical protein